ncbi:D-alanyl-D-alanine carboxypeptidase [Streptomyces sp. NPDC003032]
MPAPEERDPRLAVAREIPAAREAAAGGSTPDTPETPSGTPAGDARLRDAVAAWVATSDDDAPAAKTPAESGGAGTGSDGPAATGEAAPAENAAPARTVPAGPEPGAESGDGTQTDAESDVGSGAGAQADAEPGAEVQADAESESGAENLADAESGAGSGARTESGVGAQAQANANANAEAQAETGAEPEPGAGADPESGAGSEDQAQIQANARSGAEAQADDAEPASEPETRAESGVGVQTQADAEAKPKTGAEPEAQVQAQTGAESGAGAQAGAESGVGARPQADAESGADANAKSPRAAKGNAAPAGKGAEAASPEGAEPRSGGAAPVGESAQAASAEGAAPRSGRGEFSGVDQATAVFKAPKVTPAVDQPTTMLKLGGEAPGKGAAKESAKDSAKDSAKGNAKGAAEPERDVERDAERTSKFVALKPLDGPPAPQAGGRAEPKAAPREVTGPKAPPPAERTTQQPLPPKPPLDLLAELTNTPPPPETPVRTAVRRFKIWTPLVLLLIVAFAVVQAVRPLPPATLTLTAEQSVSFEGDKPSMPWPAQGQAAMDVNGIGSFGTSGDQKPVPIASIAKVMTVYLILRDHPLEKGQDGPKIPVDAAAQKHYETGKAEQESVVKVTEGQKISEYEALQAVMLPSANNVAKLLARWDTKSHSEDEFVAKMNKTAKELGMRNTHYTDPSGLDKTTVSTAEDLVKLGRAAMENPVFNEISRQPSYKDLNGDKQNNFFGLVPTVAIGIKTGTTTAAGGNILFAAEKKVGGETQTIIGAALGQFGKNGVANIDEVTGVTRKLIEAGQDALTAKTIVKKGDVVGQVDDGLGGTTPVVATKDVSAVGWSGLTVRLHLEERKGEPVPHTAKAGTKVGVLSVGDGKGDAVEVPVALQKDLAEPGLGAKLKRVG